MAVCAACNSRIFLGGTSWGSLTCCDDACVVRLKTELTRAMVPANELEQEVERVHGGACPECGGEGPNDVYTAKKVTGMLVAVQWAEDKHVCCCACGKKAKWKAALHCATLGWWSPKALLTNLKNLDPKLMNKPYDPGNAYSIPYLWGSSAIGVNAKYVNPATVTSFNDLWNPKYKGKLLLMDDVRDVFAMSLRSLGYSGNDTNPEHIKAAYLKLLKLKPGVKVFNSDSPKQPFLNNEVTIGQIWGGEIYQAARENPNLVYIYPKEGATFWADNMAIPASARNAKNAHAFINFMLRPDIAKRNCEYVGYATPNLAAQALLDPKTRGSRAVYPDAKDFAKGEFQADVGSAILIYEKYWEMLKTR